jgi:hypothetical protein
LSRVVRLGFMVMARLSYIIAYTPVQIINRSGSTRRRGREREKTSSLTSSNSIKASGTSPAFGAAASGGSAIASPTTETRRRTSDASLKGSRPLSPKRISHKK